MNVFDFEKTAQAAAWLLRKYNGRLNCIKLIKLMYLADKEAIRETCVPITGDDYCSMDNGPVGSRLYDFIKGNGEPKEQKAWDALFKKDSHDLVALKDGIPRDWLSDCEIDALDAVDARFHDMGYGELIEWTHSHENCPEWRAPHGGRLPIAKTDIMKSLGFGDEDIAFALEENSLYDESQKSWGLLRGEA